MLQWKINRQNLEYGPLSTNSKIAAFRRAVSVK
jgi:hypothetical protein